jgi:chromate reductase, NAD(P)H dehydrogenase (quinone)
MELLAICGSLRRDSYNRMLLRYLADHAPEGVSVSIAEIRGIPVYDGDLEQAAFPDAAAALRERIAAAPAVILATPEYNHGVPGPLKNAVDWCTRPSSEIGRVWGGRRLGLIGASAGPGGTRQAQYAWLPTLRRLGVSLYAESLLVPSAGAALEPPGTLTDAALADRARRWMEGFAAFARPTNSPRHPPANGA